MTFGATYETVFRRTDYTLPCTEAARVVACAFFRRWVRQMRTARTTYMNYMLADINCVGPTRHYVAIVKQNFVCLY